MGTVIQFKRAVTLSSVLADLDELVQRGDLMDATLLVRDKLGLFQQHDFGELVSLLQPRQIAGRS